MNNQTSPVMETRFCWTIPHWKLGFGGFPSRSCFIPKIKIHCFITIGINQNLPLEMELPLSSFIPIINGNASPFPIDQSNTSPFFPMFFQWRAPHSNRKPFNKRLPEIVSQACAREAPWWLSFTYSRLEKRGGIVIVCVYIYIINYYHYYYCNIYIYIYILYTWYTVYIIYIYIIYTYYII